MKKQKPTEKDKAYIFDIILNQNNPFVQMQNLKERVSRNIALLGSQSLYCFGEAIVDAFGFDFDHAFGFFNNLDNWTKSTDKYELFADMPETRQENPSAKSVKKNKIQDVFKAEDKMLFLFDYGDGWEFIVQLDKIEQPNPRKSYPILIEALGKAPEQYPDLE